MDLFAEIDRNAERKMNRAQGLMMLKAFLPLAGSAYAGERNFDKGRGQHLSVSRLSPFIRRRLISETEILQAVQSRHTFSASEKFISEIFWRTYFKGWLEMRPSIWSEWLAYVPSAYKDENYLKACQGKTEIACFNEWAEELRETGYLHNHARMWFASIWIFTLKLPWQWGAAFFLQWLRDGDPASNTLSWRWVAGLHSRGKHYLAKADNIKRFTNGRYAPFGVLDEDALPIMASDPPPAIEPAWPSTLPQEKYLLLLHAEDCLAEELSLPVVPEALLVLPGSLGNMALGKNHQLRDKSLDNLDDEALADAGARAATHFNCPIHIIQGPPEDSFEGGIHQDISKKLIKFASQYQVGKMVSSYLPVGPTKQNMVQITKTIGEEGIECYLLMRGYDRVCWPHAKRGFFPFKENIPNWLKNLPRLYANKI